MKSNSSEQVTNAIESLCELGCTQVNQLIDDAKNGKSIEALSGFDKSETELIINELSQIMEVYDQK